MDFPNSTTPRRSKPKYATEAQKDYIYAMLDELGQEIFDYADKAVDDLLIGEASEVIDELQDAVDFARQD